MKVFLFVLATLLVGLNAKATAQTAQSDYEIQENFKETYKAINDSIEIVQNSEEAKRLVKKVGKLEDKYQDHSELLDKVLYPDTFKSRLIGLKRRAVTLQRRMAIIEHQEEKLGRLYDQLAFYEDHLDKLNVRTDSIREAMRQSVRSERHLSNLVHQYRQNLEKRDDLILSFVDSVMVAYSQMDLASVQNLENARKQSQLDADGNALTMIVNIVRENIEFLKSNPKVSTEEYLRMNAVQQEFEEMWNKLGARIADIYAEENASEAKKQIDKTIKAWEKEISDRTWASINRAIEEEGINLPEFSNSREFYNRLNGYLDNSISSGKEKATEEGQKNYQRFNSFWTNQVKVKWSDYLNQGNILSHRQMASVDQKLDEWAINAEPESNNLLVYLLGASVLALVVLGVMLAREKNYNRS